MSYYATVIIKTNKGYICERNDYKTYPIKSKKENINDFYGKGYSGAWFNTANSSNDGVDMLGFTDDAEKATKYSSNIGNRIQEIIDRINWGFEDIYFIKIEILGEDQNGKS